MKIKQNEWTELNEPISEAPLVKLQKYYINKTSLYFIQVRRECKRKLHNYETKRSLRSSSTGFKSPKQNNSLAGKASSRSAELISQKEYNEVTRL